MDWEKDELINQTAHKLQLLNEDIKIEMKNNPCIINKEAFVDALHNNVRKFIQEHYRD